MQVTEHKRGGKNQKNGDESRGGEKFRRGPKEKDPTGPRGGRSELAGPGRGWASVNKVRKEETESYGWGTEGGRFSQKGEGGTRHEGRDQKNCVLKKGGAEKKETTRSRDKRTD